MACAALYLLAAGPTQSQPISKQAAGHQQLSKTSAASSSASAVSRGTKEAPLFVEVKTMPEHSQTERDEQAAERREKNLSDLWIVRLTAVIAVFTAVLALVTGFLWYSTKGLLNEAISSGATAARTAQAAAESVEAFRLAQRPWINWTEIQTIPFARGTLLDGSIGNGRLLVMTWRNSGQSPALRCRSFVDIKFATHSSTPPAFIADEDLIKSSPPIMILPGQTFTLGGQHGFSDDNIEKMKLGKLFAFIFGRVDYDDPLSSTPRRTEMCVSVSINGDKHERGTGNVEPNFQVFPVGRQNSAT